MRKCKLMLIIIAIALSFSLNAMSLPEADLVLHYTFDSGTVDGDQVTDLSGNGYDGTLTGGASVAGGILELDGADGYVAIPALEVRTGGAAPFTAMGWFRTEESINGPLWMWGDNAVPGASGGAEAPVGWRVGSENLTAGFYNNAHFYAESEDSYTDGEWHFVAQVGTEDTGFLYIDGEQIASTEATYIYAAAPYFILGARSKNSGSEIDDVEYFQGSFDQVAIYSVALSEGEIKAIFEAESAVSAQGKLSSTWSKIKIK
ncbi:hypothetical protein GF312_12305 [Candidatus Poribacteria bacterium]|nr:hypothetical protein [Candidatus Poribacteria bacterium]